MKKVLAVAMLLALCALPAAAQKIYIDLQDQYLRSKTSKYLRKLNLKQ